MIGVDGSATACLLMEEPPAKHGMARATKPKWPYQLLLESATNKKDLVERLHTMAGKLIADGGIFTGEGVHPRIGHQFEYRAAIVATEPQEAAARIKTLIRSLELRDGGEYHTLDGIFYAGERTRADRYRTAFVFPGQGSHYLGMFGDLCIHFPGMQSWFEQLHTTLDNNERCPGSLLVSPAEYGLNARERQIQQRRLWQLNGGGFASIVGGLALYDIVTSSGVRPDAMVGYSNGENAALIASGTWQFKSVAQMCGVFANVRQSALFESSSMDVNRGRSVAVNHAPKHILEKVLHDFRDQVFLALDNCSDQVVLFGNDQSLDRVSEILGRSGAVCLNQPFRRGHHTPAFSPELEQLEPLYSEFIYRPGLVPLYSCVTAAPFPEDPLAIKRLVELQWIRPVRFRETIEELYAEGVRCFIEIGPASNLTSFIHNTLRGRQHVAIATNRKRGHGLEQLLQALGRLFVLGHDIDLEALSEVALRQKFFDHENIEERQTIASVEPTVELVADR
jgi:acyl transferase domain-containing protein